LPSGISPTYCAVNTLGLTPDGVTLVDAMMERGMVLDVAHLSRAAFDDVYDMAMDNGVYPLLNSHAHLSDTIINAQNGSTHTEKYINMDMMEKIKDTHGMVGLRTGPEWTDNLPALPNANICQGSSRSFAQSLMYAVDNDLDVGFGADFNGFISQARKCPFVTSDVELRDKGLAHIGLLPAFIQDMEDAGLAQPYVKHIRDHSAENFLRLWQRSENIGNNPTNLPDEPIASCSLSTTIVDLDDTTDPDLPFLDNITMVNATLNASSSTASGIGNSIVSYAWDFDGGGPFGSPSTSPVRTKLYSNLPFGGPMSWTPRVKVTDVYGYEDIVECGTIAID